MVFGLSIRLSVCLSVCCCGHSNLLVFNLISSKFHIWIASIKPSFRFEYGFCLTNDKQDGRQNDRHLSVCTCGHSTLVIYYPIASKFHKNGLLLSNSRSRQVRIWALSKNQDGRKNGHHVLICTCGHSNLVIYHPISSEFPNYVVNYRTNYFYQTLVQVLIWVLSDKR